MKKSGGLGKGLSALISERKIDINNLSESQGRRSELLLDEVFPGRFQPRTIFDQGELNELSESIKRNGVVQPILVKKRPGQGYEIIAGERRWRASKIAKLHKIPAIVLDVDDRVAMEIALIENIQRQNLKVLEEAEGYKRLINEFDYTQEQLADVIGKSRSHVTNLLRLLALPEDVKNLLNDGTLSTGHARAILTSPDPMQAADEVIKKNFSVRQTENLVKRLTAESGALVVRKKNYNRKSKSELSSDDNSSVVDMNVRNRAPSKLKNSETIIKEEEVSSKFGLPIQIMNNDDSDEDGAGSVIIHFSDMKELNFILNKLQG